ncbi:homocysteine methyltransferase [Eggerthellaceae bacterium zg-893]|nr:homocysteine methyltransferase [Eggerthellaceae bacterium zg-893]
MASKPTLHPRRVRVKDDYLARVLAGEAYLVFDGGMGSLLQQAGLVGPSELSDLLNVTRPDAIEALQRRYVEAGSQVIATNTFNTNRLKLNGQASVADVYAAAAEVARRAGARYVAGDVGPTGALLEPMGTMPFDEAYDVFAEQARAAQAAGCDLIVIETMTDLREMKAAVLAAVEQTDLPVFATMTFGEDGRTFLGTTPAVAAATLAGLGVSALGVNCSLGPDALAPFVREMAAVCACPLIAQPNAGLPHIVDGQTVFDVSPEAFAQAMTDIMDAGATVVGGCCGTTPDHLALLAHAVGQRPAPVPRDPAALPFVVASAQEAVVLPAGAHAVAVIGERINPTGKKRLAQALREGDADYIVGEAVAQVRAGADILDVNVGLPDIDEAATMAQMVQALQATVTAPLQIDSGDAAAVEAAVRSYAGKPLVNSVNGKRESLDVMLPLVQRYGCAVVGLTLDEDGIPPTAEGRFAIAERIVAEAESRGIPRSNVVIDCLVMAAATNQAEAMELLRAVQLVKERLGVRTVLGVSNVSFGLPQRSLVNATFLAAAFGAGLDLPILNPQSRRYMDAVAAFRVLNGQDVGAARFVEAYAQAVDPYAAGKGATGASCAGAQNGAAAAGEAAGAAVGSAGAAGLIALPDELASDASVVNALVEGVLCGRSKTVADFTAELLERHPGLVLVNHVFIPALDLVGEKYDSGAFFLPQLMAAAEAVKAGFDLVRGAAASDEGAAASDEGAVAGASAASGPDSAAVPASGSSGSSGPEMTHSEPSTIQELSARPSCDRSIIVATVEGDIHDIGKNIAKMLLENYGFPVIDLGRDVAPEAVLQAARESGARLIGLSALMTTTVKAMERTVALVHEELPGVAVMVAGAVVTPEYASSINADFYAKDAAESARIAQSFFGQTPA